MREKFEASENNESVPEPTEVSPVRKQSALKKALHKLGLVTALLGSTASVAEAQKNPAETISKESLPKVTRVVKDVDATSGKSYGAIQNMPNPFGGTLNFERDVAVMLQHNLKKPESLSEVGKMLLEPVSISLSFPYGKDSLVAKVKTLLFGNAENKPQVVDIDIPYRYAQKFDEADPKDKEEMKRQATEDAEKLFDSIMTQIFGLSFFKTETLENHEGVGTPITKVNQMTVEGFASPESTSGVNLNDPRNQNLSEMRAENAAKTIREIFVDRNIGVDDISFYGSGEESLPKEELDKLAKEAVRLDLSDTNNPMTTQVLDIVTQYNDGKIDDESATKLLNELVGDKRKVALHLELEEQEKILVLPLPLLLLALVTVSRYVDFKDVLGLNKIKYKPFLKHSFIKSEDPSRPKIKVEDGTETERLTLEAEQFMMRYSKGSTKFFIVSSNDSNDLETANAYRLAAQRKGISVLKPKNPRGQSENITEGYVRVIKALEPTPQKTEGEACADDLKNMVSLVDFGETTVNKAETSMRKTGELDSGQQIIILAFGEGDALEHALDRYFPTKLSPTKNLEVIRFGSTHYGIPYHPIETEGKKKEMNVSFRGKTKVIKDASEVEKKALTFFRKKKNK